MAAKIDVILVDVGSHTSTPRATSPVVTGYPPTVVSSGKSEVVLSAPGAWASSYVYWNPDVDFGIGGYETAYVSSVVSTVTFTVPWDGVWQPGDVILLTVVAGVSSEPTISYEAPNWVPTPAFGGMVGQIQDANGNVGVYAVASDGTPVTYAVFEADLVAENFGGDTPSVAVHAGSVVVPKEISVESFPSGGGTVWTVEPFVVEGSEITVTISGAIGGTWFDSGGIYTEINYKEGFNAAYYTDFGIGPFTVVANYCVIRGVGEFGTGPSAPVVPLYSAPLEAPASGSEVPAGSVVGVPAGMGLTYGYFQSPTLVVGIWVAWTELGGAEPGAALRYPTGIATSGQPPMSFYKTAPASNAGLLLTSTCVGSVAGFQTSPIGFTDTWSMGAGLSAAMTVFLYDYAPTETYLLGNLGAPTVAGRVGFKFFAYSFYLQEATPTGPPPRLVASVANLMVAVQPSNGVAVVDAGSHTSTPVT